jgi:tyrosyl-tRNA synthetase
MADPNDDVSELVRNAVDSLPDGALAARLAMARRERRPLRVKFGIDPTAADIHLGHAVVLNKLREFQDRGHRVVLIIGDFTARVGDPSGRSALRPLLSDGQIEANARTYQEQAFHILDTDPQRLEVRHNSEWLDMAMIDLLRLTRSATVAQLLERDDFAKRMAAGQPISMLEMLYPLLQGYDSVAVDADVELGGTDQTFNLLFGREIQRSYGRPEQAILTMPLLVGIDGQQKMSKSLGNQIGVTDPPQEIYGKTMAIPDEVMSDYYRLLLNEPPPAISPRDAKRALARRLVARLYSEEQARTAEAHFDTVFVAHGVPDDVPEHSFACPDGTVHLPAVIAQAFAVSRSEARRLIEQGGVTLNGEPLGAGEQDLACERADGGVLRVGKRRFVRLRRG